MANSVADRSTLQHLAQRMREKSVALAERWLDRVYELVTISRMEVFPSRQLLGHIPEVIREIAGYLENTDRSIDTNRAVLTRAEELGVLRHLQHASIHQLLREYQLLAQLLEDFVEQELSGVEGIDTSTVVHAVRRVNEAVRVLQHHTVATFVTHYTHTLERQTTQLRQFSRLVSHEIRQPLAVLQVITRALPAPSADADSVRMMDIFERSVTRLAEVTGKLERQAHVAGATDPLPSERTVDLNELAHEVAAQLAQAALARGVDIQVHPNLPVLRLDPVRAELIFLNLMANAIKFSDPAKSVRYVEIHRGRADETSVIVRDNGIGMAPARLRTIFREFVRAHSQRDDDVRAWGLGLGLSIVRECMDASTGAVRVDSIEGKGTTFKLSWPITLAR